MNFPEHKAGLFLTHNEHRGYYESVESFINSRDTVKAVMSPEDVKQCIESDSLWVLQWYPRTPVGFHVVAASTLEEVMKRASEVAP